MDKPYHDGWITTIEGRKFYLDPVDPTQFDIQDIAHALGHICRWGGHTKKHFSVAQHSVIMSQLAPAKFALVALMHDAAEAYIGDLVRPLKRMLPAFSAIEDRIMTAMAARYGFEWPMPPEIKALDDQMIAWEHWNFRSVQDPNIWNPQVEDERLWKIAVEYWTAEDAAKTFYHRFMTLFQRTYVQEDLFGFKAALAKGLEGRDEAMAKKADE